MAAIGTSAQNASASVAPAAAITKLIKPRNRGTGIVILLMTLNMVLLDADSNPRKLRHVAADLQRSGPAEDKKTCRKTPGKGFSTV
jgi:hypothetical protein